MPLDRSSVIAALQTRSDMLAADFDSTIRRFESSRPSQAVRRSEKVLLILAERPANGGLLRIGYRSPDSKFFRFQGGSAQSLRPDTGILPFSGEGDWRPGSIGTARPERQYGLGIRGLPTAKAENLANCKLGQTTVSSVRISLAPPACLGRVFSGRFRRQLSPMAVAISNSSSELPACTNALLFSETPVSLRSRNSIVSSYL
jgi:hypothetical protein